MGLHEHEILIIRQLFDFDLVLAFIEYFQQLIEIVAFDMIIHQLDNIVLIKHVVYFFMADQFQLAHCTDELLFIIFFIGIFELFILDLQIDIFTQFGELAFTNIFIDLLFLLLVSDLGVEIGRFGFDPCSFA